MRVFVLEMGWGGYLDISHHGFLLRFLTESFVSILVPGQLRLLSQGQCKNGFVRSKKCEWEVATLISRRPEMLGCSMIAKLMQRGKL